MGLKWSIVLGTGFSLLINVFSLIFEISVHPHWLYWVLDAFVLSLMCVILDFFLMRKMKKDERMSSDGRF